MSTPRRTLTASLVAALGLASLSPLQQGAVVAAAGTAALWASPAMASTTIPGVGVIVKKKPGNAPIIAPTDANGETRITGLEPGTYSVRVLEAEQEVPMKVGRDGRLAFVVYEDAAGRAPRTRDPGGRRGKPPVRRWAEQIPFEGGNTGGVVLDASHEDAGCSDDKGCDAGIVLLAGVRAPRLAETTGVSLEVANLIISERDRNGPYKGLIDFAQRVCPQADVDFSDASVRFGSDTMLVKRGGDPKQAGFKCARATGEMELFGRKHHYVGHVTLLR